MVPATLYFGNPVHLSTKQGQLIIQRPDMPKPKPYPLSDIGFIELDSPQIHITTACLRAIVQAGIAVVIGDERHLPTGLLLPLEGHSRSQLHIRAQVASTPIQQAELWQQVVRAKIRNQATVLEFLGKNAAPLRRWTKIVEPADASNTEGRAAAHYWSELFEDPAFRRDPDREDANVYFNYIYAVVRAWVGRSIVTSGLLPHIGIFHKNQYNAFPLADDLMEPFRPIADLWVYRYLQAPATKRTELDRQAKAWLLQIPQKTVKLGKTEPSFATSVKKSTTSFLNCLLEKAKLLKYPLPCPSMLTA